MGNSMNTEIKYLELLSKTFKNIAETSTEIINLQAIMNLPKGTEHFMTDIHGEYEAFNHVLRNGSGTIRNKIEEVYKDKLTESEKKELAAIIYYPKEKIEIMQNTANFNVDRWMINIIYRLIEVCKIVCSKYTRSKVRKAMPKDFQYILQELLYEKKELANKREYFDSIVDTIISIDRGKEFIIAISNLIQKLNIDHLHIVGDIYDRGPFPHLIMDTLAEYNNLDIQWGNHDILWIGAALGNKACIANVIRICCRYNNNDILEEAYGINLLPFATFAMKYYGNDPCKRFRPKEGVDSDLIAQMNDTNFPTVNPENPLELLDEEAELLDKLQALFLGSEKLQKHMQLLFSKGGMYLKYNSNLLFHACIPMEPNGEFSEMYVVDGYYKGKALLDKIDNVVRQAYYDRKNVEVNKKHRDLIWYLWAGRLSPLCYENI